LTFLSRARQVPCEERRAAPRCITPRQISTGSRRCSSSKAETGGAVDALTVGHKGQTGYANAVENGLNDVDNADDVLDAYDIDDRETTLAEAFGLIASYRAEAQAPDSDEMIVLVAGLGEDPMGIA